MTANEFKRWLKKRGCAFDSGGKGGHITVIRWR
jgi:hypothetical protein